MATNQKTIIPLTICMMKEASESGDQIMLPDSRGKFFFSLSIFGALAAREKFRRNDPLIHVILLT